MGKNNKKRKRQGQHALFHAVKGRVSDLGGGASSSTLPAEEVAPPTDPNNDNEMSTSVSETISDSDLQITLSTLSRLVESPHGRDVFHSKRFKALRRTLHPLVVEQLQSYDKGTDYRHKVTHALQFRQWTDALAGLQACRDFQQWPKQGTVQRWVRFSQDAATDAVHMQLLQAILLVSSTNTGNDNEDNDEEATSSSENKHSASQALADHLANKPGLKDGFQVLPAWKWWDPNSNQQTTTGPVTTQPTPIEGLPSRILYREAAADRTPPNHYDLLLHTIDTASGKVLDWTKAPPAEPVAAHPVPFLPAPARVLANVFSSYECHRLLNVMTTLQYRPDHPVHLERPTGIDSTEWMVVDPEPHDSTNGMNRMLFQRVRHHLPQTLTVPHTHNRQLVYLHSINPRWRCFRYRQDCVYRPHLDGSWPQSFVDEKGQYGCAADANNNANSSSAAVIKSYLTFLMYLNDDFDGGETRFYLPQGTARGVTPKQGCVLVFPQGNMASLIHEGALVTRGTKYVVRTDVLYSSIDPEEGKEEATSR